MYNINMTNRRRRYKMKKLGLTSKILIGLFLGMTFGIILSKMPGSYIKDDLLLGGFINVFGSGFTKAIKMMVVPLVFISLVCGVSTIEDIKKLGRIGFKTMTFYLTTTAIAICISLLLGVLLKPGAGLDLGSVATQATTVGKNQSISEIVLNIIPSNPIESFAKGEMLQIIFFAMLTGISINLVGERANPLKRFFESANEICMKMVEVVMMFAPYGVFALITSTFATVGTQAIGSLVKYILVVLLGLLIHVLLVYGGALKIFTKVSLRSFLSKFTKVAAVTFSTASSNASVPVSLELMEEMGVSKSIRSFTIPMGATINMDGTAIMQGVAALFIAQVYGIHLGINDMLTIVLTATLASVGTAGVPGVGMIMLSMVLQSVGLPLEGIGLIMGVERIIDMFRTTVNVMGDNTCTLVVASSEKEFKELDIEFSEIA
jgi:Na+/H+-dicarboxylate symporter